MASHKGDLFTNWLNEKLREINTDENIFGAYIIGILEGDENEDEKKEALEGIFSEIIENNLDDLIANILNTWYEYHPKDEEPPKKGLAVDVDQQLAKLLEAQKLQPAVQGRQLTEEEKRIRQQILAQYSQTEVSDEDAFSDGEEAAKQPIPGASASIEKNTNLQDVLQLQKDRREQARLDSAAKKQKDKEDREKQKQMREEKKEKRKTVKGERRR